MHLKSEKCWIILGIHFGISYDDSQCPALPKMVLKIDNKHDAFKSVKCEIVVGIHLRIRYER